MAPSIELMAGCLNPEGIGRAEYDDVCEAS
jgi:hypothetical protein